MRHRLHRRKVTGPALAACLLICARLVAAAWAADVDDEFADELPRIDPREPAEALATFEVAEGYRLDLVAAEPLVEDPVAMAFDEDGRLFVVEMRGYSEHRDQGRGRVRILEDTDGDGRMDRALTFADGLRWPTAVFPWAGGAFVGAAPDVIYMEDTTGDGKADLREVVFTGLAPDDLSRLNVQTLLNSFRWGLDNRIHATPTRGQSIRPADPAGASGVGGSIPMVGREFSFDPHTLELGHSSGGNQWGAGFDDWGRLFTSINHIHNQMVIFEDRYVARNPHLRTPSPLLTIGAGGERADLHRISPPEGWRVVRTRLRTTGRAIGPVERGGELHGYVSSGAGITIVRGDAYAEPMRGAAVIAAPDNNLIHRERLDPDGVALAGRRLDHDTELVRTDDNWFRPVAFANAPDGTLWVADMYREVIEHPWSLPDSIKRHLDLDSGNDRGRIYRLAPEGFEPPPIPKLSEATAAELVELLAHDNAWHRLTASRLLYERRDESAIEPLHKLAAESASPRGRLHALHSLDGLGALRAERVLAALGDEHPRVRENAVRLAEPIIDASDAVRAKLFQLADDDDMRVRYQLAFTLGESDDPARLDVLEAILKRDAADRWMRIAALSSLGGHQGRVLANVAGDGAFAGSAAGRGVIGELARQVGAAGEAGAATLRVLASLAEGEPEAAAALLRGLGERMSRGGFDDLIASDEPAAAAARRIIRHARTLAADGDASVERRVEAIRTLRRTSFDDVAETLRPLLSLSQPAEVQRAALDALAAFADPAVGPMIVEAWPALGPATRPAAIEALLARDDRREALLDALEAGRFSPAELGTQHANRLRGESDRAAELLDAAAPAAPDHADRDHLIEAYLDEMADLAGDPDRGEIVFTAACASCHRVGDTGHDLGPNLMAFITRGDEAMVHNVLDPNRQADPRFLSYIVETEDGATYAGVILAEAANTITLSPGGGVEHAIPRDRIRTLRPTDRSLMPEGLENAIDPRAMADLIAYLWSLN